MRQTLPNGLRVVVVPNKLAPAATTVMNYLVGSDESPENFPGMAHAQEHMMFRGSPGLSGDQLAEIAANLGGEFNADTQQVVTQYFFTVPSENLDLALHIEAIRMQGVLDSEDLWKRERPAIEQEVDRDYSNPLYVLHSRLLTSAFRGTPYAHDALGDRQSFDKTTGAMLKKFHDQWYAPNNAILIITGDVQPQQAMAQAERLFSGIPTKNLPPRPAFHIQPLHSEQIDQETDLPYGVAVIACRLPGSESPDFAAAKVLARALDSERSDLSGLAASGQALSAGFEIETLPKASLAYAIAAFPKGGAGAAAQENVRKVLAGYLKSGFPADLVEAAKKQEATEIELQRNSVSGLAMAWSKAVAIEGRTSPDDNLRAIQRVTVADVNRVARANIDLTRSVTAILTPKEFPQPVSLAAPGGHESPLPKEVAPVELPAWAKAGLSKISVPASMLNPAVSTLTNGIKLIVQPSTVSHTVTVYGHIENEPDLETPPGKEGVADLLERLFSYGTETLDRLGFQKALDDIGARESAGATFSLEVLAGQFDRGLQLLAENELHPALPEKALLTARQQLADTVKGQLGSPDYLAQTALRKLLYPIGDPALREATPETVSALSLDDVNNYYRRAFRPDLTTIVVMGEITPEKAREAVQKYFGGWSAAGPKPSTALPGIPQNKLGLTSVPDANRVQDSVTLAQTLGLSRSDPDYYALELGNHVLGGGFYATRLYRDLRENGGLVYNVSSYFDMKKNRGAYIIRYACDPQNVLAARGIVEGDLRAMQMTPVTDAELHQAKAMLLRQLPLSESSVTRIVTGMIERTRLGLPLDEPTLAARRYLQLTAAEVQAAFTKWIRVGDLVQVTEGPAPK